MFGTVAPLTEGLDVQDIRETRRHCFLPAQINLVIHIARAPAGRRVKEVARVTGREGDAYVPEACVEG